MRAFFEFLGVCAFWAAASFVATYVVLSLKGCY